MTNRPTDSYASYRKVPFSLLPGSNNDSVLMEKILQSMRAPRMENGGIEAALNERIPAGFTYLGQFITHDISPSKDMNAIGLVAHVPKFHLDTLYGKGPNSDPLLYVKTESDIPNMPNLQRTKQHLEVFEDVLMRLNVIQKGSHFDIERESDKNGQAISKSGDVRNDRNYLVAQIYCAFVRFHNAVAVHLHAKNPGLTGDKLFDATKKMVVHHYQWLILHQYLPMLVGEKLVQELSSDSRNFKFFNPQLSQANASAKLMPEFSGAVFRLGHSQVRDVYVFPNPNGGPFSKTTSRVTFINSAKELYFQQQREAWLKMNGETRKPLKNKFPYFEDLQFLGDLRGNIRRDDVNLTMDWQYFFDFGEDSDVLPQSSLAIDHHIADSLYDLFFFTRNREKSLPKRDFNSSRQLPSGHSIHLAMALANPDDPALHQLLTTHEVQYNGRTYKGVREVMGIDELRVEDLSLGHYVLLEAEIQHDGKQLGALGSRIVAEQIIWVLLADDTSILHQHNWQPDPHFIQWRNQGLGGLLNTPNTAPLPEEAQKFSIVDLLQYITAG